MLPWILSCCVLTAVVIALRYGLRGRVSPRLQYALWLPVLVRLLLPFSLGGTTLSVMNAARNAPLVQEAQLLDGVERIAYDSHTGSIRGYYAYDHMGDFPTVLSEQASQDDYERISAVLDGKELFHTVWKTGACLVLAALVLSNLRFRFSLNRTRRRIQAPDSPLPVYETDAAQSPFLFGLLRPGIYVTAEARSDPVMLRHIVEHETSHFLQGDHVWLLLRGLCLALHWYNPLVWWAALLSRRDSELACDALTIRRLGERERASYGRTLIAMTCGKRASLFLAATTMAAGNHSIRERILMIAKKPKTAAVPLAAVLLVLALAVGCTFTGADGGRSQPTPEAGESPAAVGAQPLVPEVALGQELDRLPEEVTAWAVEYVGSMAERYARLGDGRDYLVTGAKVTGLTQIPTGTAALDFSLNLYRLEYRIQVDRPENLSPEGGMRLDGSSITEWSEEGQPCLLLYAGGSGGREINKRICVTYTRRIESDYGTPEMLERYGDPYIAAVMELYAAYQSGYTLNGVSITLEPGFTVRENAYPCLENSDGVLVGLTIVPREELRDFSPADQPLELASLPTNEYGWSYSSYTFEGEFHYNAFRAFGGDVVAVQLACRAYDARRYEALFPKWASTAAPAG